VVYEPDNQIEQPAGAHLAVEGHRRQGQEALDRHAHQDPAQDVPRRHVLPQEHPDDGDPQHSRNRDPDPGDPPATHGSTTASSDSPTPRSPSGKTAEMYLL